MDRVEGIKLDTDRHTDTHQKANAARVDTGLSGRFKALAWAHLWPHQLNLIKLTTGRELASAMKLNEMALSMTWLALGTIGALFAHVAKSANKERPGIHIVTNSAQPTMTQQHESSHARIRSDLSQVLEWASVGVAFVQLQARGQVGALNCEQTTAHN